MWSWADQHYFLFFILVAMCIWTTWAIALTGFRVVNRWLRSRNIRAQGWPPVHLDADGDWKP